MKVAILKETFPGERRVAVVPAAVPALAKAGLDVVVETGAGSTAGFADDDYRKAGAGVVSRDEAFGADALLTVRTCGAGGEGWIRLALVPDVSGCREAMQRWAAAQQQGLLPA